MSLLEVNGSPATAAQISMPRHGLWVADLLVDLAAVPDSVRGPRAVSLSQSLGGLQLTGTVVDSRADAPYQILELRVVGGGGGLSKVLSIPAASSTTVGDVVESILDAAGENLSDQADSGFLGQNLDFWVPNDMTGFAHLSALLRGTGAIWRALPDGTIWIGSEQWRDFTFETEPILEDQVAQERVRLTASDRFELLPGWLANGEKVSYVEHTLVGGKVRTVYWIED